MASINFNNLRNIFKGDKDYTFSDIHLDIKQNVVKTGDSRTAPYRKDIAADYDESAIRNSIINIFNTSPGERFLIPTFGSNLRAYLFRPVTQSTAQDIGNTVLNAVEKWEPRVIVENVTVLARPIGTVATKDTGRFSSGITKFLQTPADENEYVVVLLISIPTLRKKTKLEGVLTESGFSELQMNV